jgi:predicted amidohydrolase YtcJ
MNDRCSPPILVWDSSEHFVYANSASLKKYKVTRDDTKFTGVMAGPDGEPKGQFLGEKAAQRILKVSIAELLQSSVALANMRFLMDLSRQNGITTTSEMAYRIIDLPLEEALFDRYFNDLMKRCEVLRRRRISEPRHGDRESWIRDGRQDLFMTAPDQMVEAMRPRWEAGFQINVHINGNGGNQATINALGGLMALKPRTDPSSSCRPR